MNFECENFPVFPKVSMIEPVDKRERRLQHLCRKKRNNGFTWMADQISVKRKKKKTNFFLYWGPRKSRGQSGKRKSDLKRYFTTEVFNDFYKVMTSILKAISFKSYLAKPYGTKNLYNSAHCSKGGTIRVPRPVWLYQVLLKRNGL